MNTNKLYTAFIVGFFVVSNVAYSGEDIQKGVTEAAKQNLNEEAAATFESLAEQGDGKTLFSLGLMYHSGSGVPRDEAKAVRLYHEAAKSGHTLAQEYLSAGYENGWFGLKQDQDKAKYWAARVLERSP